MASLDFPTRAESLKSVDRSWLLQFLFAIPLLYLGWMSWKLRFLSDDSARLISKALIYTEHGRLPYLGLAYPNIPLLMTAVLPSPLFLSILSALAGGVTYWMIWRHFRRTTLSSFLLVVMLFSLAINMLIGFSFTQSLVDAYLLMLFAFIWRALLRFVVGRVTWMGFIAGLLMALAFFFNVSALTWGVTTGLSTFALLRARAELQGDDPAASYAVAGIIAFPVIFIALSWFYVSWMWRGNVLAFLYDAAVPVFDYLDPQSEAVYTFATTLRALMRELAMQPLAVVIFVLLILQTRDWLAPPLTVLASIITLRAYGFNIYSEALSIGTFSIMALMSLPRSLSRGKRAILLLAALLQIVVTLLVSPASPEIQKWRDIILANTPSEEDVFEQDIALLLAKAPPRSILADDDGVYRFIARGGTAIPYLLPGDIAFAEAKVYPKLYVDYIVVADPPPPTDEISIYFGKRPPEGFKLALEWPGWKVYQRRGAPGLAESSRNARTRDGE